MPTIYLERFLTTPAASVREEISDIRLPERPTNMIHTVEVIGDNVRACATDHVKIVETIIAVDGDPRRLAHTTTQSPFPVTQHKRGTVVSDDDGSG